MALRSRLLVAALLFASMLGTTLVATPGFPAHPSVNAGHADVASHLSKQKVIARNLVRGASIRVCSDDYPLSTKAAVQTWNGVFRSDGAFNRDVFPLTPAGNVFAMSTCSVTAAPSVLGLENVVVRPGEREGDCNTTHRRLLACYVNPYPVDRAWSTSTGQGTIFMTDSRFTDGDARTSIIITHDLFHALGFDDYREDYCVESAAHIPSGGNYFDYVFTDNKSIMTHDADCFSSTPTSRDRTDFNRSYQPNAPTIPEGGSSSPGVGVAVIVWDAINVHVESGFVVQRKRPTAEGSASGSWTTVATHEPLPSLPLKQHLAAEPRLEQRAAVELTGQPPGAQTYRVVSRTYAPLQAGASASREFTVVVQATPSTPAGLNARGGDGTITLTWNPATDRPPITGYEYSLDDSDLWVHIIGSVHSTTSYTLGGLENGTEYTVRLRAVRGSVKGHAASVTATPRIPPPPPPTTTTLNIVAGIQTIVWPGETVSVATAVADHPIVSVWYQQEDGTWVVYIPGAPSLVNSLETLETGETYAIRAREAFTWTVTNASSGAGANTARDAAGGPASLSGWTATVTCDSGRSPIRLGVAPTEAEAIGAATWLIDHSEGCGGSGTYTTSDSP